jgi:hypothetical protein
MITETPVRVTAAGAQPLHDVRDVSRHGAVDLELSVFEGSNVEVRLVTSMQREREDGWVEVDRFVPTSAPNVAVKPFFPLLRYARWEVLSSGNATFLLRGIGRSRMRFAPTYIDGCILWLRSDLAVTLGGSNVEGWGDRSGRAHHASQATSADRPAYVASGWSTGLATVDFDRSNTEFMDLGAMSDASNDYTLFAALHQRSQATNPQDLLSARGATACAFAPVTDRTEGVGIHDGAAWRPTGAEQEGEQILTWVLDSVAGSVECHRDGASIGTNVYDGSWIWDNPELGRLSSGGEDLDAEVAEVILYSRKLEPHELARVHGYLVSRYRP